VHLRWRRHRPRRARSHLRLLRRGAFGAARQDDGQPSGGDWVPEGWDGVEADRHEERAKLERATRIERDQQDDLAHASEKIWVQDSETGDWRLSTRGSIANFRNRRVQAYTGERESRHPSSPPLHHHRRHPCRTKPPNATALDKRPPSVPCHPYASRLSQLNPPAPRCRPSASPPPPRRRRPPTETRWNSTTSARPRRREGERL